MAGHSKWANTKHRKGRQDAKKAKIFTKLARAITVAVKEGGTDPEYNASLANAIEKAKAENMPNDNIDRAIKKGAGSASENNFESITYEGYGPCGTAFMVQCLTDNKNRTAADIRHYFSKYNGNLGSTGCVSYLFERKGVIAIKNDGQINEEDLMLTVLEVGADDLKNEEDIFEVITPPENFMAVLKGIKSSGYNNVNGEVLYIPQTTTKIDNEEDTKTIAKLIDALEDNDDVQEIYHNWEIPDDFDI